MTDSTKRSERFLNILYITVFVICVARRTLDTTMWDIDWPQKMMVFLRWVIAAVLVARLVVFRRLLSAKVIFLEILVTGPAILTYICVHSYSTFLELMLLVGAGIGMRFRDILKWYLTVEALILVVTVTSSQVGLVENLVYEMGDITRISFGYVYPTDFTAHIFFMAVAWLLLRESRITYGEIAGIAVLGVLAYYFCHARANAAALIMAAVGALCFKLYYSRSHTDVGQQDKEGRSGIAGRILAAIGVFMNVICCAMMIALTYFYDAANGTFLKLDTLLSSRLSIGRTGFDRYDVGLLAQKIKMIGYGRSLEAPEEYFYLDCSYVNTLLRYGLIVMAAVLLLFFVLAYRSVRRGEYIMLFCIALISVQCMIEHHMLALAYDPILFALFAAPGIERREGGDNV